MSDTPIQDVRDEPLRPGATEPRRRERKAGSNRAKSFFTGLLAQSLKWIIAIICLVILIVTVVVVTVNRLQARSSLLGNRVQLSEEFTAEVPLLEWYSGLGELRGSTADVINRTFVVVAHVGYDQEDRAVQTELVSRTIQIRELISFYFASRTVDELKGVDNRQRVKSDLTIQINRIMRSGKIRDVAFDTYQLLEF